MVIRRTIATYQAAIEKKDIALYRSVRPGLSAAEETRLRDSFRQVDAQQVAITIEDIHVDGRTATVRVSRQDTVVNAGRRQTQSSRQTLRLEKTGTSWIITAYKHCTTARGCGAEMNYKPDTKLELLEINQNC